MEYVSAGIGYAKYTVLKLLKVIFFSVQFTIVLVGIITTALILWWVFAIPVNTKIDNFSSPAPPPLTPTGAV